MTDLFKSKENEFYIELKQDRYYFPGEDISGDVVLDLKKATKTNNIKLVLEGKVEIGGRDFTLFSKSDIIAQSPDGDKSYYLEAYTHRFPFRITIPSGKECHIPSTLEVGQLLKVSYELTATYNKALFGFTDLFSPSTSITINMLENVNVESVEFAGQQEFEKELMLSGESDPVRVSTVIGKRAAVKGDIIPISITIEHIGVIVRDRAIRAQLLRSVYYGKNKSDLYGPKCVCEATANIDIAGPTSFTKTFGLKLVIPPHAIPTVDESGKVFKIEYSVHISINLNEENPLRPELDRNVVIFNAPFTVGTYPKLSFNIDDDDEEEEAGKAVVNHIEVHDEESVNSEDFNEMAEKMKEVDLDQHIPPETVQQKEEDNDSTTESDETTTPEQPELPVLPDIHKEELLDQPQSPSIAMPPIKTNHSRNSSINSITKTRMTPSDIYNDYPPASPITHSPVSPTNSTGLGRQSSVHWVVRNKEPTSPQSLSSATPQNNPSSPVIGFAMPTPCVSQSDTTSSPTPQSPPLPHLLNNHSPPIYNSSLLYKHGIASQSTPYLQTSPSISSPYLHTAPSSSSPYLHASSSVSSPYLHTSPSAPSAHSGRIHAFYPQPSPSISSSYIPSPIAHSPQPQYAAHHNIPPPPHNEHHQNYPRPPIPPRPVSPNAFPQDGHHQEPPFYHHSNNSSHIGFPMPQHSGDYPSMPMYQDYKPTYPHTTAYH
ncbi:hypothetical protein EDC96DRAFT_500686 [Choanephora cucurbitarum]|nr:hypothetical protein EDC96DRAFT_500686 [Choanephora cucurbitarum]